jgi:tRNA(Ile)-lysidine synthase
VSNNFPALFLKFNRSKQIFAQTDTIIVAISGGLDSVVLTHLLKSLKQPVVLAHCNFQLREAESYRDEQFVRALAAKWKIAIMVETYDTKAYAEKQKIGIQLAARQLRYNFFERLRKQLTTSTTRVLIATAHHANDNAETLLFNLFRGTGIDGLRGIPVRNGHIVRPLLFATREMILRYAQIKKLVWTEDSSNEKETYSRNYIRHKIMPAIEAHFPQALQNMVGTTNRVNEASELYHNMVDIRLKKMVVNDGDMQKVPVLKLAKAAQVRTLIWEWLKPFGFSEGQVEEVIKLLEASNGSYLLSATHRLLRNRAWLILSKTDILNSTPQIIENWGDQVAFSNNCYLHVYVPEVFHFSKGIKKLPDSEVCIDAGLIQLPLILRPWKAGDYFYPLGMQKKKKVARFLIDNKVPPQDKKNIWVLESNKRIVWLVGYRIDDRFKLTGKTKQYVQFKLANMAIKFKENVSEAE